ncbi:phosphoserine transaminase [Mariniluteicoccus flavus]
MEPTLPLRQAWDNGGMPLEIPPMLLPRDGRFGCGPAKVRPQALTALLDSAPHLLGTSHRQPPVKELVARVRSGLRMLYDLPDGYEVVLGNGGSTAFWDVATCSLVERRSAHGVFGEFSSKFARAAARAPFLDDPVVTEVAAGGVALPTAAEGVDTYAWAHNETSTGALAPVERVGGGDALVLVDGTSAAGTVAYDVEAVDAYYFAPQKGFASDGGLWFAFLSPRAIDRMERISASGRWIPEILDLKVAHDNAVKEQTLNTPAVATLFLMAEQISWLLEQGGLEWARSRSDRSAHHLYAWAEAHAHATPFVAAEHRSPVVATIDFDETVDAARLASALRANGIVDTEPYRKLGRNQLRVGLFPAVDPEDVSALTRSIDYLLGRLARA